MQSNGINRSIQYHRYGRAVGEAPSMGRITKIHGVGLAKRGRRKRKVEGRRGERVRRTHWRVKQAWSLALGGLTLSAFGLIIGLWLVQEMRTRGLVAGPITVNAKDGARVAKKFTSPSEADSLVMVQRALAIREPGQIAEHFRTGGASPQQVVEFLQGLEAQDGAFDHHEWLSNMDANGLSIDGVLVHFKGEDKPRSRVALLTPDASGKWRIDFDAFARTVRPAWNELLGKGVELAQVRVCVAKDRYYNGLFSDDRQWICYGIASPDTEEVLLGYCKTGSPQAAAMAWIFSKDETPHRATLEIRRVAGAESRQFEISKVLAEDWVLGDAPFDEGFQ